jgi:hypothetical protein
MRRNPFTLYLLPFTFYLFSPVIAGAQAGAAAMTGF